MPEKDASEIVVRYGIPVVAFVSGWFLTAFRAGKNSQKVLSTVESIQSDVSELKEDIKILHGRSQQSKSDISYIKGLMDK